VRLVLNRREQGYAFGEASEPSQTASHVEQVAMDNESEVAYVRAVMENLPILRLRSGQAAG